MYMTYITYTNVSKLYFHTSCIYTIHSYYRSQFYTNSVYEKHMHIQKKCQKKKGLMNVHMISSLEIVYIFLSSTKFSKFHNFYLLGASVQIQEVVTMDATKMTRRCVSAIFRYSPYTEISHKNITVLYFMKLFYSKLHHQIRKEMNE